MPWMSFSSDFHISSLSYKPQIKFCFLLWITLAWKEVFQSLDFSQFILAFCSQYCSSSFISFDNSLSTDLTTSPSQLGVFFAFSSLLCSWIDPYLRVVESVPTPLEECVSTDFQFRKGLKGS